MPKTANNMQLEIKLLTILEALELMKKVTMILESNTKFWLFPVKVKNQINSVQVKLKYSH
jgi:hypothetical protein